ncbi:MAG: hypothetical protein ACW98F_08335 [Candidatus Hodarchaeales archaeon]
MASNNPKLAFIRSIAQQARKMEHEISSEMKSSVQKLQSRPKSYYTLQDVEEIIESLKEKMISFNKEAHTEFSKRGLKDIDNIDLVQPESDSTLIGKDELTQMRDELESLRQQSPDTSAFEKEIMDLKVSVEEKESEISLLKSKSGTSTEKYQEQLEEINRLQELFDETQREMKQAKLERDKIEAEYEVIGNTLMTTRLEIEELQTVLGNRDIEVENLKSEVQVLTSHAEENITLKEQNNKLSDEITNLKTVFQSEVEKVKKLSSKEADNLQEESKVVNAQIREIRLAMADLEEKNQILEKENEDLIIDSGETSEEALTVRKELSEVKSLLDQKSKENDDLNRRILKLENQVDSLENEKGDFKQKLASSESSREQVEGSLTHTQQEMDDKDSRIEKIQSRLKEAKEAEEKTRSENRALITSTEDLQVEIQGKDERIDVIEKALIEARENLANLKIEYEKQKSSILEHETQLKTKSLEVSETMKELETLREKHESIREEIGGSRAKSATIERQKETYEVEIKSLGLQLKETNAETKRLEKKINSFKNEITKSNGENEALNRQLTRMKEESEQYKQAVEVLKINLSKNPKYAILFVLQDIQQASVEELAKTVAIQLVFAERLMKELESEGWIEFNTDRELVTLKRSFLDIE